MDGPLLLDTSRKKPDLVASRMAETWQMGFEMTLPVLSITELKFWSSRIKEAIGERSE